jgi:hypothetical protein
MSKPEVLRKTGMGNETECTGFLARTTIKPETKARLDETESIMAFSSFLENGTGMLLLAPIFKSIYYDQHGCSYFIFLFKAQTPP